MADITKIKTGGIDVAAIEQEARKELETELATKAKTAIKAKLKQISDAERVVTNLKAEYEVLLRDVA